MRRKYPIWFFLFGLLQNMTRYILIGLTGIVLWIIGLFGVDICKTIGAIVLGIYLLICIVEQFIIRSATLKESDNPELNEFFDQAFGIENQEQSGISASRRIVDHVNGIILDHIESQDTCPDEPLDEADPKQ